jgi:diguanylate cyclase (GGDEF)-like protein
MRDVNEGADEPTLDDRAAQGLDLDEASDERTRTGDGSDNASDEQLDEELNEDLDEDLDEEQDDDSDDRELAEPRRRGLGRGLGAILSAHGRVEAHAAQRDAVTGLPNRSILDVRLEEALARCREDGASLAVLLVSLDNFSKVNELFGHRVGDDLLHDAAARLSAARRRMDTVARFAGDEFVVVCPYVDSPQLACSMADRILQDVSRPVSLDGVEHRLSASIGIVLAEPGPDTDSHDVPPPESTTGDDRWRGGDAVETLLGDASLAMRHAKEHGGGAWKLFVPSMRQDAAVRYQHRQDLRAAMDDGGLVLRYEPIVDLESGAGVGECAIVDWRQPGTPVDDPGELLDLVDEADLAAPIGRWVLDEALRELSTRRADSSPPPSFRLWVKVAPSLLGDPSLVEAIDELTAKHRVSPSMVGIDVREPSIAVLAAVEPVLRALEDRDVAIAFDEFGAGPANLAMLPSLPVSGLKLAPELLAEPGDERDALIRGLADLGRALGLAVVAQGVETEDQAAALRALGCAFAQGPFALHRAHPEPLWATASLTEDAHASLTEDANAGRAAPGASEAGTEDSRDVGLRREGESAEGRLRHGGDRPKIETWYDHTSPEGTSPEGTSPEEARARPDEEDPIFRS